MQTPKLGFTVDGHSTLLQGHHPALLRGGFAPQGCLNPVIPNSSRDRYSATFEVELTGLPNHVVSSYIVFGSPTYLPSANCMTGETSGAIHAASSSGVTM